MNQEEDAQLREVVFTGEHLLTCSSASATVQDVMSLLSWGKKTKLSRMGPAPLITAGGTDVQNSLVPSTDKLLFFCYLIGCSDLRHSFLGCCVQCTALTFTDVATSRSRKCPESLSALSKEFPTEGPLSTGPRADLFCSYLGEPSERGAVIVQSRTPSVRS
ncbi:hypothetical protein AOLI_G00252170 [Acnodon oligacanthus]